MPARREFRTRMKRQTLRKQTAVQRIEMNRFWNELEEVFDRLEDVRAQAKVDNAMRRFVAHPAMLQFLAV